MSDIDRVPRHAGPHRDGKATEIQTSCPVLGGPGARHQLTKALAIGLAVVVGAIALHAGAAYAHTEVQRAEPGPAGEVSGTVSAVTLLFVDAIRPGGEIVVVRDDDDETVAGLGDAVLSDDARTLTVDFDPLPTAGRYRVTYDYVALDGHAGGDSYTFTYRSTRGVAAGTIRLVVAAGVGAVVLGAIILAVRSRRSVPS